MAVERRLGLPRWIVSRQQGGHASSSHRHRLLVTIAPRYIVFAAMLVLALAALLPRVTGLNDFYTTDEAYFWQGRVARFSAALQTENWAATNQTGHPGVTTMWLGTIGRSLAERAMVPAPGPGAGAAFLGYLRLPLALVNALAVVVGYLLLRRLLRAETALLAAALWASSPFLIAHGRLLHLDGLLASFMTLALLCALVATVAEVPQRAGWLVRLDRLAALIASGVFAGLALLTKAPALLLLPAVGLLLFGAELAPGVHNKPLLQRVPRAIYISLCRYGLWLAAAALLCVALWPAMWANPLEALGAVFAEIGDNGAQPHNAGNFFMGQAVGDPGWSFYGAVVRWRSEPTVSVGLLVLLVVAIRRLLRPRQAVLKVAIGAPTVWAGGEKRTLLALGAFVLLVMVALTLLAKKFDRYLLPAWPALQIVAAIGLMRLVDWWRTQRVTWRRAGAVAGLLALCGSLVVPLVSYRPYYLAYYNPLLGGGATAQQALLVGWGEGMDQIGAWLSGRPDLERGPVLSWLPATLEPFLPATTRVYDLDIDTLNQPASYAVVYNSVAERDQRAVAEAYALQTAPLFTLRIQGITYATVHQLPRPYTQAVGATFGNIHLRGFSHALAGSTLLLTPSWDVQADRAGAVFCFVHVLDVQGQRVGQIDAQLDDGMFASWQAGQQFGTTLPIALPPELPAGNYQVLLGLYTMPDGARLPLISGEPAPAQLSGPDAIQLMTLTVP